MHSNTELIRNIHQHREKEGGERGRQGERGRERVEERES